jgi:hypothetical protein
MLVVSRGSVNSITEDLATMRTPPSPRSWKRYVVVLEASTQNTPHQKRIKARQLGLLKAYQIRVDGGNDLCDILLFGHAG